MGGTEETDKWLRMANGECRFLLPPDMLGERLCAIYNTRIVMWERSPNPIVSSTGIAWANYYINRKLLRPEMCQESPCVENIDYLSDCPVVRAARERLKEK